MIDETEELKSHAEQCRIIFENFQVREYVEPVSGRIIKIYEMIHLAPTEFYQARNVEMAADYRNGFVIHHEGIKSKLGNSLKESYVTIAECLGWDFQKLPTQTPVEVIDANFDNLNFLDRKIFDGITGTVSFILEKVAKSMKGGVLAASVETFRDAVLTIDQKAKLPIGFNHYLLEKRNRIALRAALSEQKNVSLVWGKAHREGLEAGLFQAGFQPV